MPGGGSKGVDSPTISAPPKNAATTAALPAAKAAEAKASEPHSPARTWTAQERAAAAALANRGDAMLANKDVVAARAFYEYAANAGSARAAAALAQTYDPAFLDRLGVVGPRPNPEMAAAWYRKAVALGDDSAEARLRTLTADAGK